MKSNRLHSKTAPVNPIQAIRELHPGRQLIYSTSLLAFISTIAFTQAAVIEFDLSPPGTDDAPGMSPANQVPAATGSTGSGNAISGGITFDTNTSTLVFVMGYGTSAGFADLTGAATGLHLHGPAAVGANAGVLFDLSTVHFPSPDPAKGGVIFGSVVYPPALAADLLAGRNYVNIHTAAFPNGEIRGQLVRVNTAPEITCPASSVVECGPAATYTATVSDFDGDAVQATWALNGAPMQNDQIAANGPPTTASIHYTAPLPLGINHLTVTATDSAGNTTTCDSTITVVDTTPPLIVSTSVRPRILWSPNHKMVPAIVHAIVRDACGPTSWKIVSVSSNQAVNARGSGNTSPDWRITGDHTVLLRAERSGNKKEGRVYTIRVQATDSSGNKSAISTVRVSVPHSMGRDS